MYLFGYGSLIYITIENYIAKCILNQSTNELSFRLEQHIGVLDKNESKQLLKQYEEFLKVD